MVATDSQEEEDDRAGVGGGLVSRLRAAKSRSCYPVVTSQLTASDKSME